MRWLLYAVEIVRGGLGLATTALSYERYWRWRDCFNEQGRCFDPVTQDVYLEQAGLVWGMFTAVFIGTAVILLLRKRS